MYMYSSLDLGSVLYSRSVTCSNLRYLATAVCAANIVVKLSKDSNKLRLPFV
jgi:hypothetical protein